MISPWVAAGLANAGYECVHVRDLQMSAATDIAILVAARDEERTIISADLDFTNLLAVRRWEKPSLLLLRDMPRKREALLSLLVDNLPSLAEAIEQGSIITFKGMRVRVRRLPIRG